MVLNYLMRGERGGESGDLGWKGEMLRGVAGERSMVLSVRGL